MIRMTEKPMAKTSRNERNESVARINQAVAAYEKQKARLEAQTNAADDLAERLKVAYTQALAEYEGKGADTLHNLTVMFNKAEKCAERSYDASLQFQRLIKEGKDQVAWIKAGETTITLGMREDKVFCAMSKMQFTNGTHDYGLHTLMLSADAAYAEVAAFVANLPA